MKEEIARVLTMVQEGKIDAVKGSELIQVLQDKDDAGNKLLDKPAKYSDKTLKVRIVSTENDNVTVNLPIKLVKVVLLAGHSIAASIPQSEKYVKDLDINLIMEAIENELDGQIVDIKSANGDSVSVYIE
ncbi:SHOCT-like domain-containing protein [Lysinibacillus fusiformis]|uniref:SHOCT-like domain-containing protein n=1 Tax=Lysinibacillus fusiformis TaxID=28031 RepID=UPI003AB06D9D